MDVLYLFVQVAALLAQAAMSDGSPNISSNNNSGSSSKSSQLAGAGVFEGERGDAGEWEEGEVEGGETEGEALAGPSVFGCGGHVLYVSAEENQAQVGRVQGEGQSCPVVTY